jgi:tubulin-specific chaperone C
MSTNPKYQAIKALFEKLQETRAKFVPKARFAFRAIQKNGRVIPLANVNESAAAQQVSEYSDSPIADAPLHPMSPPGETNMLGGLPSLIKNYNEEMSKGVPGEPIRKPSFSQASNVSISNHQGLHIILPSSASNATSSGALTELTSCIVDMSIPTADDTPFASLTLNNIKHSLIIAGQVAGAAHITGVEESVIVVLARQVRMHECRDINIYLLCNSRPIIEDCSNVRFAPIPACYVCPFPSPPLIPHFCVTANEDSWILTG